MEVALAGAGEMSLTSQEWHIRFSQQAVWTRPLREYLFQRININRDTRILDVGCGTGALLQESLFNPASKYGIDIQPAHLSLCSKIIPEAHLTEGNAYFLPYGGKSFELTFCHFLLLWLHDPTAVLSEMIRVTKPGGAVLTLAEPDYGGRIDYPDELSALGDWQEIALRGQNANPRIGRQLSELYRADGLERVEVGVLGGQWSVSLDAKDREIEWMILRQDLSGLVKSAELDRMQAIDEAAWKTGKRILFVPTFYAVGFVASDEPTDSGF